MALTRAFRGPGPSGSAAAFTPDSLSVGTRHLEVGNEFVASFGVTGYPQEVFPGWLAPLLTYPARLDVSVHVQPVDPAAAASGLRRQRAKLESSRRHNIRHDRLDDPDLDAAADDAAALSRRIARGEGKLFKFGLYLTVHAPDEQTLAEDVSALRSLCASLLLDAKPTTYRALQGWVSTLPLGLDQLGLTRTFDTPAVAAAYPFTSPDLPAPATTDSAPGGVLYGYNLGSSGLVHWDRFACDNYNSVILGRSGSGKSYLVKLEILRSLYRTVGDHNQDVEGVQVFVVDPEDEYARLSAQVGGTYLHLGANGIRLNPFDLPVFTDGRGHRTAPRDALKRRSLFLHTVLGVLFGAEITAAERTVLDTAITTAYTHVGITNDPRTWTRPAPLLRDLRDRLAEAGPHNPVAADLAARLHPFVDGAFSDLFDGPTTATPDGHLNVFSLRDLPDELRPVGALLVLDEIWRRAGNPAHRRPRMVVVDEAWLLMRLPSALRFLLLFGLSGRKRFIALMLATPNGLDLLAAALGKPILDNSATVIVMGQQPQAAAEIAAALNLSAGERHFIATAGRGQGLLVAGTHRVAFEGLASPAEHELITTDPAELARRAEHDPGSVDASLAEAYLDLGPAEPASEGDDLVALDTH
uniref:Putative type IV secretory VirB4 protein n=1 Tax=Amycolatopsis sp. SANK 60206 TaxID=1642649 RepID=A0A0E3USB7_9PSEU|nr:putative type IV secretory VirB4 protein [Amycolatopsis sp. SANK 60206]